MLQKGFYAYEYKNDLEKFNETSLTDKEDFYSNLNIKNITDADYLYTKRVFACCSLLPTFCSFACTFLLVARYSLLIGHYFLLAAR